jgi:gliding motility-associated-like protein
MHRNLLYFLFLLILSPSWAQTVSIKSNSEVCMNELLIFQSVVTGAPTSYTWNFGDGSSSTQSNPSHTFANYGQVTVTLTVSFSGSASVSATKIILVNDLPKADFSLDNSGFCSNDINVCITDNSTMGATTSGYASREILWGEGSRDISSSPSKGQRICFKNYPTGSSSPYTIIVEVVNDKGCENKWQKDITILQGFQPSFSFKSLSNNCDEEIICITNDSVFSASEIQNFVWKFGDGTTNSTDWSKVCHPYTASGKYSIKLTVTLKNGCKETFTRSVTVKLIAFEIDPRIIDSVSCFPTLFRAYHQAIAGATYSWVLYSKDTTFISSAGSQAVQSIEVPCPDDYLLRVVITLGGCTKTSRWIKLVSNGVFAMFRPLNWNQCESKDTVYFLNQSKYHPKAVPSFSWFFDDSLASNCLGYKQNCNKDTTEHTRHFYVDTGCMNPSLMVKDLVSGCVSRYDSVVKIRTSYKDFQMKMMTPCLGNKPEYGVQLNIEDCEPEIRICTDSLANPKLFSPLNTSRLVYGKVTDKDGWVTVGFATRAGDSKVYRSINLNDYYINQARVCRDTVWKHNWFQLHPEPRIGFKYTKDSFCLPSTVTVQYTDSQETKMDFFKYIWNIMDTFTKVYITDSIPSISHTFTEAGKYSSFLVLQDTFGCYNYFSFTENFGYENQITSDTQVCRNSEVTHSQYVQYFNDSYPWWQDTTNREKLMWDFGDGGGFSARGPDPKHTYSASGTYIVRMASNDRNGCVDTAYSMIQVAGISAAIKKDTGDYLCDQIIQFFDSSYFDLATADKVNSYSWDFGDFTTISLLKDPFHYYSSNGHFTLALSVKSDYGCVDTASIPIYIKGPEPYFDIISDTVGCVPFTASFSSSSNNISALLWRMGDANGNTIFSTQDTSFSFTYDKPGTYYIYLEGSDSFYNKASNNKYTCSAIFPDVNSKNAPVRRIIVLPIPKVDFSFSEPLCAGKEVKFTNESDTIYTIYNWEEDGVILASSENFKFTFSEPGMYTVSLHPTYIPSGPYQRACFDTVSKSIQIYDVTANFDWELRGICNEFFFSDSSTNAASYFWNFDHPKSENKNTSVMANPSHFYGTDAGDYNVCLTVSNEFGCQDVVCKEVTATYMAELKSYNVFTPNDDGYNDVFILDVDNVSKYDLKIYDRWGECVFESIDPKTGWSGKRQNTLDLLPSSSYFYMLRYTFNCEKTEREIEGIVDLLR